jgi:DNA-binding CsgD family transcriptional regulator
MGRMLRYRYTLSKKEQEILQLLTSGRTNKEIAGSLRLSPETVKMTLKNIFRKLGVENRTQAAVLAVKERLTGASYFISNKASAVLEPRLKKNSRALP